MSGEMRNHEGAVELEEASSSYLLVSGNGNHRRNSRNGQTVDVKLFMDLWGRKK
jgi:hypothetical protein